MFERLKRELPGIQEALQADAIDGWLLYELKGRNPIAAALVGHEAYSRRYFVWLPAEGEPVAIMHAMEIAPFEKWPWQRRLYASWRALDEALLATLPAEARVAMEYSERDAMPLLDIVPAGVVELVRASDCEVVSSADLITRFYSRWSDDDLVSHRRTAAVLADVAAATFAWLARGVGDGASVSEGVMQQYVVRELAARGAAVAADCIAATGVSASDPHYHPQNGGRTFQRGDLVLLDLWAKEAEEGVFADQTWMAYLGPAPPARAVEIFAAIRDARDAAIAFLHDGWQAGRPIRGGEVDDVARRVIEERGYGPYFLHRTGHSIDRSIHGVGPNIDNHETRELRQLVPGIGFSIEPGIYIANEIGLRTEINVYIGEEGPEVTTPRMQSEIAALLDR